jgi:hypothetical protein
MVVHLVGLALQRVYKLLPQRTAITPLVSRSGAVPLPHLHLQSRPPTYSRLEQDRRLIVLLLTKSLRSMGIALLVKKVRTVRELRPDSKVSIQIWEKKRKKPFSKLTVGFMPY